MLDFPRGQFQKRGWMEFRQDVDEHVPFSIAAAIELLSRADMLVGINTLRTCPARCATASLHTALLRAPGNMGSHVSRIVYDKMVGASSTSQLPPFISVDGYATPTSPRHRHPRHLRPHPAGVEMSGWLQMSQLEVES